ncbi:MAG: hypothetical protein LYZ66_03030 [Nitrososphaerales archaeon]|nr:hypothetical protein [Nitrososphaerales archaeon]
MFAQREQWRKTAADIRMFKLSPPVRLLVPALLASALPRNAIGFSFERGKMGVAVGAILLGSSLAIGGLLYQTAGVLGFVVPMWLFGTAGALMLATGIVPLAFVKPLCSGCRLLPVIQEHEAIHLAGTESDEEIWKSMRSRHSSGSLALEGDPSICWFCPIPKRLKEH